MSLTEVKGDLFGDDDDNENCAFAHCVSKDLKMGAGIAVEFKKRFGRVRELKDQNKEVGEVAELDERIFYLVTKEKYFHKPTYDDLKQCLICLKERLDDLGIEKIKIPRLGCGLDRLDWNIVKEMIKEELSGIEVVVHYL